MIPRLSNNPIAQQTSHHRHPVWSIRHWLLFAVATAAVVFGVVAFYTAAAGAQAASGFGGCIATAGPPAPAILAPPSTGTTASSEIAIEGTAGSNFTFAALSDVGGPIDRSGVIGEAGATTLTLPLVNGEWLMAASLTDTCGNQSPAQSTLVDIDVPAPALTAFNASVDGETVAASVTADRDGLVAIEVLDGSEVVATRTVDVVAGTAEDVRIAIDEGTFTARASIIDALSRQSVATETGRLSLDLTPPSIDVALPVLSADPESLLVRVDAEEGAVVNLFSQELGLTAEFVSTGVAREYQFATEAGDYALEVTATDAAGNSVERTMRTRVRPTPAPVVSPFVVAAVIGAILAAITLLWRWLRGRENAAGEAADASVFRPQSA